MDVLILNTDAQPLSLMPISVRPWDEVIKKLYIDSLIVIEEYPDWVLHSPSVTIKVPSIVMTKKYVPLDKAVKFNRYNLLLRDNFQCQYCHADYRDHHSDLTLDHVLPKSMGGVNSWTNSVAACPRCNTYKGNNSKIKPKIMPKKPTYFELVEKRKRLPISIPLESWNDYLMWDTDLVNVRKR